MKSFSTDVENLGKSVLEEISCDEIWKHMTILSQWKRIAGSPDEAQAFSYIKNALLGIGAEVNAYTLDSLIGIPEDASIELVTPESKRFEAIAHGLIPSTPPEGIEAELVYVGRGKRAAYAGETDVSGKIVLIEGLASPYRTRLAEDNRALVRLSRILIPINYTIAGPFDHDPAVPIRPIPVLYPVTQLGSLNPESNEFRFLYTRLVRESNKVRHALKQAADVAGEARTKLGAF